MTTPALLFAPIAPSHMLRRSRLPFLSAPPRASHLKRPRHRAARTLCLSATQTTANPTVPSAVPLAQVHLYDICGGPVPYTRAWEFQHALVDARRKDESIPDALVLLEHEPVYTLGTASSLEHVLFSADELRRGEVRNCSSSEKKMPLLVRTERGGEVTYHGPGQLVAYPILNLKRHRKDLHWYLRALEEVVVKMLRDGYGLCAGRKDGLTGVWVGDEKVCAMGLKVSRWITMHGLALNLDVDLAAFDRIVPCGVEGKNVTSVENLVGRDVGMEQAKEILVKSFCEVFGPYDIVHNGSEM